MYQSTRPHGRRQVLAPRSRGAPRERDRAPFPGTAAPAEPDGPTGPAGAAVAAVVATTLALSTAGGAAHAQDAPGCGIDDATGRISILANDFVTTNVLADAVRACAHEGLEVEVNLNTEVRDIQVAALSARPAAYTAVLTANGSVVPLLNENLVRPLDDLVAEFGEGITERQKITIGGEVMAIAFMANAQHLVYRQDVLDELGLEPPTTWDGIIEAAAAAREAGLMRHPIAGTYKSGFNLGLEFVNHYLALGGRLFEDGTAEPALVNDIGLAALERMRRITEYMDPDFLTMDTKLVVAEIEQGAAAFANLWGSSAGSALDEQGAGENVVEHLRLAAAPLVGDPARPAATLWWDGFTIARNADDADAAATFRALAASTGVDVANAHPEAAVWLADGYEPVPTDAGVFATIDAGAAPYPVIPWMSLMNVALGTELVDFLQGDESARKALEDVEASYRTEAQAAGFL